MTIILLGISSFCLGVILTILVVCQKIFKYEDSLEYKDVYIQELEYNLYRKDSKPSFDEIIKTLDEF